MMSRHFGLSAELSGAIAKRLPHAKNQLSMPASFFNQFVTYIYIFIYIYTLPGQKYLHTSLSHVDLILNGSIYED